MQLSKDDQELNLTSIDILQYLNKDEILLRHGLKPKDITVIKKDANFNKTLNNLIQQKKLQAKDILSLVIDKLREIDKNLNTKQWLEMIYCYCQFLSFPETSHAFKNITLPTKKIFTIFLLFYRFLVIEPHQLQKKYSASSYPLLFLTEKEISSLEQPAEYQKFLEAYNRLFVYEMMVLGKEIFGYNTCDHICGVHTLALSLARQLKSQGLFLDLGIISGAAAGHDIGKYGCKSNEQEKVPYLHYYYTDIWFQRQNIPYIGHIAVNHSVWDLELENLSLESLILIYSDFRVKNIPQTQEMYIYSLQDSFRIILEKLDNLDRQKERRYKRVFAKLQDFEEFLIEKGIETCPVLSDNTKKQKTKNSVSYSLLHGEEIIKHLKQLSLEHSFNLMYQLRNEPAVNSILELARSEKNWQNIQDYLRIFSEYSTYLNQKEKLFTLRFLYEKLIFPEEGIRRRSAKLIGYLIAGFDEKYRKEIPENVEIIPSKIKSYNLLGKYIQEIIEPKHKVPEMIYARVRENLAFVFEALFEKSQGRQIRDFRRVINGIYKKYTYKQISKDKAVCLLQAIRYIPFLLNENIDSVLVDFLDQFIEHKDDILRLNSLSVIEEIIDKLPEKDPFREKCQFLLINKPDKSVFPVENYLCYKLLTKTKNNQYLPKRFQEYCQQDKEKIDRMYLTNLKTSTDPIIKKIQIDILLEKAKTDRKEAVYTALHFCNILKVSSHESIRNYAGKSLIKIIPYLNMEHKNDIAIELLKALEIDDYQYTKYIPYYLGQLIPFLPPGEIDEFIAEFEQKTKISDQWISVLLLRTIAVAISRYAPYQSRYNESSEKVEDRLKRMLGILMNGLVHQDSPVKRITSHAIGREIFASEHLTLREKSVILRFIAKKLLNLLSSISIQDSLLFFTNTVALHQIYVYMSDYIFFEGSLKLAVPTKVAFFPGSFDPFSTSHKEIVKEIEKMGIEVYLSVDEYSWSKRTQPHLYRKNLINMSIADELDVYLYPENLPNNIANPTNLKLLKKQFPFSKIYIVAGSDVLLNASAYSESNNIDSIMHFPHIIFSRKPFHLSSEQKDKYLSIMNKIKAEVIQLNLETPFEEISSSLIRKNIDNHRDITGLVDPLAERFIYQHSLYQREPQFKATLQKVFTEIEIIEKFKDSFIQSLVEDIFPDNLKSEVEKCLKLLRKKQNPRLIILKDTLKKERKLGFAAVHWVRSSLFYHEFQDNNITQFIRDYATGRTIIIDGVFITDSIKDELHLNQLRQIILTQTLTFCVQKDYDYAIFKNMIPLMDNKGLVELMELYGFTEIPVSNKNYPILAVDIRKPSTVNLDIETLIKEPFVKNKRIIQAIYNARKSMLKAMTQLYPGHLLIPFNMDIVNQSIVKKVCHENGVSIVQSEVNASGPLMCVPFGKILHKMVVPNTVTKSLHTDKIFTPDMQHFKIDAFSNYMSLENQVKMIKSFNKPVLLIDDLLHKGYRLKAISPLLQKEKIKVHKIIVGLISGRGKELAMMQKRSVDSAYFIPNLRVWFNESDLCPFIGGDGLFRQEPDQGNLVRSINMILPYAYPVFLKGVKSETIYRFSEISIENAINIILALEEEYQEIYHRKLTLGHLGEVCIYPRYPDQGKSIHYDLALTVSLYLENNLELLQRSWEREKKAKKEDMLLYPNSQEFSNRKEVL